MHHWNVATLCFFSLPIRIRRGSTCAPSVCSMVQRLFGLVCLITVIHVGAAAGFSISILWYDGVKMWPFFPFFIVPLEPGHSKHTLPGWGWGRDGGCCSIDAESSIHSSLLTSAFSSDVIRRYKWQLLAWSLIHRGGAGSLTPTTVTDARCSDPLLAEGAVHPAHNEWQNDGSVLPYWLVDPYSPLPSALPQSGYWHLPFSHLRTPESHNCWLVRWVKAVQNN